MFKYGDSKKVLISQIDMMGVKNIRDNKEHKPYFQQCIYKYFVSYPKKNDDRSDYNDFYRQIQDKSMTFMLSNNFNVTYETCLKYIEDDKLSNWHIGDLEKIIAKFEIATNKIITMQSPLANEYICTKDEIIEFIEIRDLMIERVDTIRNKTMEYRKMMSD
ncbi:hypothetical protein G9F72_018810 [Clostridium estertheticum]|uniref:hypothetical protein n=1 Tax=Clostridium estertheticum TaxID=238834 RepID=UPI0013E92CAD|nr:hypothetical protein [Clostridium estertheticum]MBZ9688384.1 hypothetical protein [Clostridium estertheticum]